MRSGFRRPAGCDRSGKLKVGVMRSSLTLVYGNCGAKFSKILCSILRFSHQQLAAGQCNRRPFVTEELIVSPSLASTSAWRNEPAPLSFVMVTVMVAA
jgi:hypothetical protein